MSDPTITVPNCTYCGMASPPGESFCRNCGRALARTVDPPEARYATSPISPPSIPTIPAVASPAPDMPVVSGQPINVGRRRRSPLLLGCLVFLGLGVIAAGAGGFYAWRRTMYTPPARTAPAIPERAAGTMTEFPVDSDSEAPATPASVETEALGGTTPAKSDLASQTKLPPGMTRSGLAKGATSMTSSTYQSKKKTQPTTVPSSTENVYICVLTLMPNQQTFVDGLATTILKETGGEKTGVKVESNTGFVYVGSKIRSSKGNVYVLTKQGTDILILIYSSDPNPTVIDRLAQNVGNGQGLIDYREIKDSLWTLPATTPADLTLIEISTLNRAQIENSIVGDQKSEDAQKVVSKMRSFIPNRLTGAKYLDANRKEWVTYTFEYGSSFQAWRSWLIARIWLGFAGASSKTVRDVSGIYLSREGTSFLVFQKGPYIIALMGPGAATSDSLVGLGNLFQV
ncbi:MAG TPA: zinc ribbon domain-containing protein [Pyrinomonadaceae bacterium]|nr:zinc ribbon domain-containing protein [Pyrinomonadaceae bacterium]